MYRLSMAQEYALGQQEINARLPASKDEAALLAEREILQRNESRGLVLSTR